MHEPPDFDGAVAGDFADRTGPAHAAGSADHTDSAPRTGPDPGTDPAPVTRRTLTLGISMVATVLILAVLMVLPAPYAIRGPGPTENTLGKKNGTPLISITGAPVYDSTGQLRLTTVSVSGGPGYPVTAVDVVRAWFSKDESIQPVEEVYPPQQTKEESEQQSQAEMVTSQEDATVAALTELGYKVPATLTIAGASKGTGAYGVVKEGDVITTFDGKAVTTYTDLLDDLDAVKPGTTVKLGVTRDGKPVTLDIKTTKRDNRAVLGVFIDPAFDFPVDVKIKIDDIGGPSAGTMFALGIMDLLTPADEANGKIIAGTGTMDVDGDVGPIGGIEQKMVGAKRDGATWFLAPSTNCKEVVGAVPSGLNVVKISTLEEAWAAVKAIGAGDGATLPTCTAAK